VSLATYVAVLVVCFLTGAAIGYVAYRRGERSGIELAERRQAAGRAAARAKWAAIERHLDAELAANRAAIDRIGRGR